MKLTKLLATPMLALALVTGAGVAGANALETDVVENAITDVGNQILTKYVDGDISTGMSLDEVQKKIGKLDIPEKAKGLNIAINYSEEVPANFSLCGWDDKGQASSARGYFSESGTTTAAAVDCSSFAKNEVVVTPTKSWKSTPRPTIDSIEFSKVNMTVTEEAPVVPAEDKKVSPLWYLIPIAVLLLGIGAWMFTMTKNNARKARKEKALEKLNKEAWEKAIVKHDKVKADFNTYRLDPARILKYPLLNDRSFDHTQKFHQAMQKANNARIDNPKLQRDTPSENYVNLVDNLDLAYKTAEEQARRINWNNFTAEERERLQDAQKLLNLAMDQNSNEHERQGAYKRLRNMIDGLIELPEEAVTSIEQAVRKEILPVNS